MVSLHAPAWEPSSPCRVIVTARREEATVPQKTPQKHAAKKAGKSLKEKREVKKAKKAAHKPLTS